MILNYPTVILYVPVQDSMHKYEFKKERTAQNLQNFTAYML